MGITVHERFMKRAIEKISQNPRMTALLAGGSMMQGTMDAYSDLDLVIVYNDEYRDEIMEQRIAIAEELGHLLSAFTGEHVGEPRLVICLYGPEPLHVDLKFVRLQELAARVENPLIVWERGSEVAALLQQTMPSFPMPDPQWIEDRFWVWVHYGATKLGRGELFECIDHLAYMRSAVLGPLVHLRNGQLPRGVRKLESYAAAEVKELQGTVPSYSFDSCYHAMKLTIEMYRRLRQESEITAKAEAERISVAYLDGVYAAQSL